MIKLKPKMLRGVSFSIESNGKEVSVDSLFPRGFKTKLIERFLEEFSSQIRTDDPEVFVKALFYFVYGNDIPKHAREKEPDIVDFLRWRIGSPSKEVVRRQPSAAETDDRQPVQEVAAREAERAEEESAEVKKQVEPKGDEAEKASKTSESGQKKRIKFTDVLPYAYRGDDEE